MGELLGQAYVSKYFPGESKALAQEMVDGVAAAFAAGLPNLEWMDDTTRARAKDKLDAITTKIGYPEKWKDYANLRVSSRDFFGNMMGSFAFGRAESLAKVGQPVDPAEWHMTPPTVNAYYNPLENEIVFPAGIMQAPFFDRAFPAAMNYGALGMVVGHEITHGFDDSGRKFSPTGQLKEWWEPEAAEKFEGAAQCVNDLYSGYEVQPDLYIKGGLTLGENIADMGGIGLAFNAYQAWKVAHGDPGEFAGFTSDQLLFVGFAQSWCGKSKPEAERLLVETNPHSPAKFRVNGPLSQSAQFWATFECEEGTPMHPADVCEVW